MTFAPPPDDATDPRPIMARLIDACPEFEALRTAEVDIAIYMRLEPKIRGGKAVLGMLALPVWQGALGPLASWLLAQSRGGRPPDFLMILDAEWWSTATPREREALVFHQLLSAMQAVDKDGELRWTAEGRPAWATRAPDVAAFTAEVTRYGAWNEDIRAFLQAAGANRL